MQSFRNFRGIARIHMRRAAHHLGTAPKFEKIPGDPVIGRHRIGIGGKYQLSTWDFCRSVKRQPARLTRRSHTRRQRAFYDTQPRKPAALANLQRSVCAIVEEQDNVIGRAALARQRREAGANPRLLIAHWYGENDALLK
jgi:hypothetical protein